VVRLSALCARRLYPQEIFLRLFSVRSRVDHKAIVRSEGFCSSIHLKDLGLIYVPERLLLKNCQRGSIVYGLPGPQIENDLPSTILVA